jgi:hypothetical protein
MDGIAVAQDRDRWLDLVNSVMNLRVLYNAGNFLTSFSRTLFHGVSKLVGWLVFVFRLCLAQAICLLPLTADVRVRSHVCPCDICGAPSGSGTGFPLSTLDSLCQYHYTKAPYSFYQKDERAKPGKIAAVLFRWVCGSHE